MTETRLFPTLCPHCGHLLDAATGLEAGTKPSPGDFSICLSCIEPLRFNDDLRPVAFAPGEYEALAQTHPAEHAELERGRRVMRRISTARQDHIARPREGQA